MSPRIYINNFSYGLDVLTDPRSLPPNGKETTAGTPDCVNVEITKTGSLISSTGFELVSSGAGRTGAALSLFPFEQNATVRQLIVANDDDYFYITPSSSTWTSMGDYGTTATKLGATSYYGTATNWTILGNDTAANTTIKWDGTTLSNVGGTPPDRSIVASFMGRLFSASGHVLSYTNTEDEDDWAGGGTINFNDIITGLRVEGTRLFVFTRTYHQGVVFQYSDASVLSVPVKEPYERKWGALTSKAITKVGSNVRYWADDNRVYNLGSEEGVDEMGLPRPMPISRLIDPALNSTNVGSRDKASAVVVEDKEQWWLAVPNTTSTKNNLVYVYNENWNSWTIRSGFYPSDFAVFRDSDYVPQLYFSSALAPSIYQFNDEYSYDQSGYLRKWRSKKFTGGDNSVMKEWKGIDLSGAISTITSFTVRITVDQIYKEYTIDNTHLEVDAKSELIGDNTVGDIIIGGSEPTESTFKRFKAFIPIHNSIRQGYELEILIYNNGADEPWKIDEIGIEYDYLSRKQRKAAFINNNPKP